MAITRYPAPAPGGGGDITDVGAGAGLTGGGPTGAVTLAVGAGTGITVNADDVALSNTAVAPGTYTNTTLTVDQQGRLTAASSGSAGAFAMTYARTFLLMGG